MSARLTLMSSIVFASQIVGCANDPNTRMTEIGAIQFVVAQIAKDEFRLELIGPGAASKSFEAIDAMYDARAKELCGGRRFLSNVSNTFPEYRAPGAFGATFKHTGIKRSGTILCQNL